MAREVDDVRFGAGTLRIAPLGTTLPTTLTGAYDAAFTDLGYTKDGSEFSIDVTTEDIEVEEELVPIKVVQTKVIEMVGFELAQVTARNLQIALGGGVVDVAPTGHVKLTPPTGSAVGTSYILAWDSDDGLERWIFPKVIQVGSVAIARKKAPDYATIPMEFRVQKPASGDRWIAYMANEIAGDTIVTGT